MNMQKNSIVFYDLKKDKIKSNRVAVRVLAVRRGF